MRGFIFDLLWHFIKNCDRYYYKMRQLFCYKMRQKFITKCVRIFITKCDSFITKCDRYYKLRRFYYKIRQVLQIAAILLQNATVITKCDVYYQLRQYISCQTVHCDSTYVRVVLHRQVSQRFTLPWKIFPNCKNKLKNQLLKVLLSKYTQSKKQSSFHV